MSTDPQSTEGGNDESAEATTNQPSDAPQANSTAEGSEGSTVKSDTDGSEALQMQIAELQDKLLRSQAEMENFRRRMQREMEDARRYESLRLVRDLLPGLDGLQRAVGAAEQTGDTQQLLDGIKMVSQQFRDILKAHNAQPIEAMGKPFDPNEHEALTQVPSADCEPMTVLQVVEMGYKLHDRVVRPARVIVSCAPAE